MLEPTNSLSEQADFSLKRQMLLDRLQSLLQVGEVVQWKSFSDTTKRPKTILLMFGIIAAFTAILWGARPAAVLLPVVVIAIVCGQFIYKMMCIHTDQLYAITNRRVISLNSSNEPKSYEITSIRYPKSSSITGCVVFYTGWTSFSRVILWWVDEPKKAVELLKSLKQSIKLASKTN